MRAAVVEAATLRHRWFFVVERRMDQICAAMWARPGGRVAHVRHPPELL